MDTILVILNLQPNLPNLQQLNLQKLHTPLRISEPLLVLGPRGVAILGLGMRGMALLGLKMGKALWRLRMRVVALLGMRM